jgi:hypothetical protein
MSKRIHPIIAALFTGPGRSQPVAFEWWLISRHGRPFLLLPRGLAATRTGLCLYSAQRLRAKIYRKIVPTLLQSPLARFFERIQFQADASADILQFMAQQVGIPAERIYPPAIKLSGVDSRCRLVLLLCDESGRPARVIKAGLNEAGRRATDQEADFLAQLPANKLGCIRLTGRLATPAISAFATDYFPGTSPYDDAGLEHLFHDWLNPGEPVPLESLPAWRDLAAAMAGIGLAAWPQIQAALAGKKIRSTLYHGDFAPWNVRVVNSRNLQAFDWERGHHAGVPGWDWFHFTIQTAILARRHSPERAAAEVEQLVNSPRFQKYAAAAGIGGIVEPLVLSYLLHHLRVIRPLEGGATTARLFEFLSGHWQMKPLPAPADARPAEPSAPPGVWATARRQLNAAAGHAFNLFWEPNLNFHDRPSLAAKILFHWRGILFSAGLLAALGAGQFFAGVAVSLMPLYVAVCVLLAWKTDRRIGTLMAVVAAMVSPLVVGMKNADYASLQVISWNSAMSFIILETGVLFAIRIREQNNLFHPPAAAAPSPAKIADHWAVLLACGIWFAAAAALDWATGPHLTCRPLYLFPCMMVTLVFNLHWGVVAAALAAFTDTVLQSCADARFQAPQIFGWNLLMRFTLFLLVIVLLDRIRRDSILFSARK